MYMYNTVHEIKTSCFKEFIHGKSFLALKLNLMDFIRWTFFNTETSLIRTSGDSPMVSGLTNFDCTFIIYCKRLLVHVTKGL